MSEPALLPFTARRRDGDLLRAIGGTPLVELDPGAAATTGGRLFAKLESVNPGGSIKDRPVARMLQEAMRCGRFTGGRRLLDSSSGNAGVSYAQLGAALGVPVTLVVPGNASRERLDRIRAHGAELVLTDPLEGYDYAIHTARALAAEHPDRYWYADQYSNPGNWQAHFDGTGLEILQQVKDAAGTVPDALVAGVGTGGTITGVGRRLRMVSPSVQVVAVLPDLFPGLEGLKTLDDGDLVPPILDLSLIDRRIVVAAEEAAEGCRELALQGLFVGPSSGAFYSVARRLLAEGTHRTVVTVLADTGERYGSTGLWAEAASADTDLAAEVAVR